MYKTLLISAAFLGASVIGAAAQSAPSPSGGGNISAATHCKDKTTGQARLKTAANPGATSGTTGAASGSGSMSGSRPSGSTGSSAAGSPGSSPGTSGPVAANLPDCP
jgi:hypothetical protein